MRADSGSPALSVILASGGRYGDIAATFRHLQGQTVAERLEVIILTPETNDFGLPPGAEANFQNFRLVRLGHDQSVGLSNAEGVRLAAAPLVVFTEDHVFAEPA